MEPICYSGHKLFIWRPVRCFRSCKVPKSNDKLLNQNRGNFTQREKEAMDYRNRDKWRSWKSLYLVLMKPTSRFKDSFPIQGKMESCAFMYQRFGTSESRGTVIKGSVKYAGKPMCDQERYFTFCSERSELDSTYCEIIRNRHNIEKFAVYPLSLR